MATYRRIKFFETSAGRSPVADYIEDAERFRKVRATIVRALEQVESQQCLPTTLLKKLSGTPGIWEVRVQRHRFLGFFDGSTTLVLAHAFPKQSQKAPKAEIEVAIKRQKLYFGRQ